ncbi:MAG: spore coat protein CotH [Paraglaciecola sp.]|jgi:spore coat protein CotH
MLMSHKCIPFLIVVFLSVFLIACGGSDSSEQTKPAVVVEPIISQFSFLTENNPSLSSNINLSISGTTITGRFPAIADWHSMIASVEHTGVSLVVSETEQTNAVSVQDFSDIKTYTVTMEDGRKVSYMVDVVAFTGLPLIYLTTSGNASIDSKEDYMDGTVSIKGGRDFADVPSAIMKIRGRGNSTWFLHPKKPFQMKLDDKSTFLDMPSKKKWLFLAEYSDKTMLRNTISFEMGYLSNLDWTPKSTFAEVYINDEYNGTYNITEKVEEGSNRVDIGDNGFLLEIDQLDRQDPDDVYFYTSEFLVAIKEPSLDWDDEQYNYIKAYINEFEATLFASNFADPINGYSKYIDVDSFVDWYLISEITKNVDSRIYSSIYFNLVPGEKIKMGPLWDFDLSFGNVDYADSRYSDGFWVKDNPWIARLFTDSIFIDKVKTRFAYFKNNQNVIMNKIDTYADKLNLAQQENDAKWQTLGKYVWPNPLVFDTYSEEVAHLKSWYSRRMTWLDDALNNL